jgi:Tol biopolymer transport system component
MAGILETKSQLKRRIKMIAKFKKTSRPRWAGAMLLLAALGCIVLTNAYVAKADYTFGTITNLGPPVNTSFNEGIPRISSDGLSLYFTSDRPGGFGERDLWVAKRTSTEDQWEPATNLGPTVNSSDHDWAPSISTDGLTLYFCSWKRPGGHGKFDIWQTVRPTVNDEWGTPENLGSLVNTPDEERMPWISADGLEIYFARIGNSDTANLYVSKRATITDTWSEPVNLSVLNTASSESEPSLSADGLTMFFTSTRPGGFGEGDLYVSTRETKDSEWSTPLNLGKQINTQYSEVCPCLSFDGHTLYFCDSPWSNVPPGSMGGVDIWQVSILPIVDFNNDGNINIDDLIILVGYWDQNEPLCDIGPMPVGDGIVDIKDIEVFMNYWEKENIPEIPEEEL